MDESLIGKSKNKNQVECKNLNLNLNNKKNHVALQMDQNLLATVQVRKSHTV